jgi:hypothetical protein
MKNLIKKILIDESTKYKRVDDNLNSKIIKFIQSIFNSTKLTYQTQEETYGDVRIEFCRNNKEVGLFVGGDEAGWDDYDTPEGTKIEPYSQLMIEKRIVDQITTLFKIRKNLALNFIVEYFEDNYFEELNQKFNIKFDGVDEVSEYDFKGQPCMHVLDQSRPNFRTREEKLEFIRSTGRGNWGQDKSDKELDKFVKDLWRKEKLDELGFGF